MVRRRLLDERAGDDMEAGHVASGDVLQRGVLDGVQHLNHRVRCGAAGTSQADQERPPIGVVESAANQTAGFETIEDAAQRRGAVTKVALQLTDGVWCAICEERYHMRLALRQAAIGQEFLEPHAGRMRRPLQLDDHLTRSFGVGLR